MMMSWMIIKGSPSTLSLLLLLLPHAPPLHSIPTGQRFKAPLDQQQQAALARLSSKKSPERKQWLEALVGPLAAASPPPPAGSSIIAAAEPVAPAGAAASAAAAALLSAAGVEVEGSLETARGRVLPAPHLAYQTPECCYPGSQVRKAPTVKFTMKYGIK
jgi:hypothetical protein